MSESDTVLDRVRRALGRTGPLLKPPTPPAIDEPITRLVHTDIGLPELFARRAEEMKMHVDAVHPEELFGGLVEFLKANACHSLVLTDSPLLERLRLAEQLNAKLARMDAFRNKLAGDAARCRQLLDELT